VSLPLKTTSHCTWLADYTAYCRYQNLCYESHGEEEGEVVIVDPLQPRGTPIPANNELSDNFSHDYDMSLDPAGLPYRSFFEGRYENVEYLQRPVQWVNGPSVLAAFDADNYNIYHWATTILPAFTARVRELHTTDESQDRRQHLLKGCPGYQNAYLRFPKPTQWQWALAEVALGRLHCTKYVLGSELARLASTGPLCFRDVVVPGASINLFTGPADTILFRKMIESQLQLKFVHERVTYFKRTHNRLILNEAAVIECLRQVTGLPVDVVEWTGDTPWRDQWSQMTRTVMLVSAHGSPTNHAMFMKSPAAVVEILPDRFQYVVAARITLAAGHFYYHYMAQNRDTVKNGVRGRNDNPKQTTKGAFMEGIESIENYRDVDIHVNIPEFARVIEQARDMVMLRRSR